MPRQKRERLFEYSGYWIGREPNHDGLYRYWLDGRRVRRRKLAATELEPAKAELVAIVSKAPSAPQDPESVMMAAVLSHYRDTVILPKRREEGKPTTVEKNFELTQARMMDFLAKRSAHGKAARVSEFDLVAQRAFWRELHKIGCSPKSISTYLSYIAAAVNLAATPKVVERDGVEVEISILTRPIKIVATEKKIADALDVKLKKKKVWIPTLAEMAKLIDAIISDHVFNYVVIALNTWARPEAITDLNFKTQISMAHGLIDLLPEGREQNHKFRPTLPLTDNLRAWALYWDKEYPVEWKGERVRSVKKAMKRAAKKAGLHKFGRYTLRHFMATTVRSRALSRGRRVTREQRSLWLGHSLREGSSTTDFYEHYDPEFLAEAKQGTDLVIKDIDRLLEKRSLMPPTMHAKSGLSVVAGGKGGGR